MASALVLVLICCLAVCVICSALVAFVLGPVIAVRSFSDYGPSWGSPGEPCSCGEACCGRGVGLGPRGGGRSRRALRSALGGEDRLFQMSTIFLSLAVSSAHGGCTVAMTLSVGWGWCYAAGGRRAREVRKTGEWECPLVARGSWFRPGLVASSGRGCERVREITVQEL